jgi:hypothetical protein
MTTITLPRATVEQALEAMRCAVPTGKITLYEWDKAVSDLNAALAQQAEPMEPAQKPITRLFGTLPVHDAQQAEPVEPVAWLNKKISFDEAMRLKDQMPKGLFRRVDGQAADEIWLCAIEVAERHHGIIDPQIEDRLARHGIPTPGDPK